MDTRMGLLRCLIALVSVLMAATAAAASVTHDVGDSSGWQVPSDPSFYSTWAANKTFNAGDKLVFKWTGMHNVAEVSKREYEECTNTGNPQGSSPVTITLEAASSRYFICTVGPHCSLGQKLSVTVGSKNKTPAPSSSSAPAALVTNAISVAVFTIAIIFFTCT